MYNAAKKAVFLFALLVGALSLVLPAVFADDEEPTVVGPVPPFTVRVASREWSENRYYRILYPRFGIKGVDAILDAYVKKRAAGLARVDPLDEGEDDEERPDKLDTAFDLFAPSGGYVSVVFSDWHVLGRPHPSLEHYALTFELRAQRRLAARDLFSDWNAARPKLMALIRAEARELGCRPEEMRGFVDDIAGGDANFYLDPDGAAFIFNVYDSALWQYNTIGVEKEALLKIGANPKFWKP